MPNYSYNVVYSGKNRGVIWQREPQSFPGSARDFAQETLLAWIANNSENVDGIVVINVWDADLEGTGNPKYIACQLSNHQLDEGPFDRDQIYVEYGQYYIHSAGHIIRADPLFSKTSDMPFGLIAPLQGPTLMVRTGHDGWINLKVAPRDTEPAADLSDWEAAEQVTIKPPSEVVIAPLMGKDEDHYPDLRGGRDTEYLTIRVSVRGRDKPGKPITALNPPISR